MQDLNTLEVLDCSSQLASNVPEDGPRQGTALLSPCPAAFAAKQTKFSKGAEVKADSQS